jgi:hypothetical protein
MIRKRISYVEDSFEALTQESLVKIKPFIITRKKVSRVVRKTIRNQAKNWIEDYLAERTDEEVFNDILANRMQKPLSLRLKKTYPLSLCEIRVFEVKRPLEADEIPKIKKKEKLDEDVTKKPARVLDEGLDQFAEIEEELKKQKVEEAEEEIKKTQEKAVKKVEGTEPKPKKKVEKKEKKKTVKSDKKAEPKAVKKTVKKVVKKTEKKEVKK